MLELNRQFYQTFALQFSQTRQKIQPGVRRILSGIPKDARILDLGCGNGELWRSLVEQGFQGQYVGLDASVNLLQIAESQIQTDLRNKPIFIEADLASPDWDTKFQVHLPIGYFGKKHADFDFVFAFAVFHHLPGQAVRLQALSKIHALLVNRGYYYHSEWQFLNSPKLRARVQPWSRIGLDDSALDSDDYLLDWRAGGSGLRYVHQFNLDELAEMASRTNFVIQETFASDGETGNLSLYQRWSAVKLV